MKYYHLPLILILALLASCASQKEQFLSDYRSFIKEVDEDHKSFSEKDWEKRNPKLKAFLEEDFKALEEEFTEEEKNEIAGGAMRYYLHQYKEEAITVIESIDEEQFEVLQEELSRMMEAGMDLGVEFMEMNVELMEDFARMNKKLMKKLRDKGILDRMEKAAKEIERSFEE